MTTPEICLHALRVAFVAIGLCAWSGSGAAELRQYSRPPMADNPAPQPTPRALPPDRFYRDFAMQSLQLDRAQRDELIGALRTQAEMAKHKGRYEEASHYYRLLDAVIEARKP